MASQPKALNHPTFGPCELIPSLVAIKWATPRRDAIPAFSEYGLQLASAAARGERGRASAGRDPSAELVNSSDTLAWATSARPLSDALWRRLSADSNVEWVAPVYRAKAAEAGPRSYFAINPTVLLLTQEAAARIGDVAALDSSVTIDRNRTNLMKGHLVLNFPNRNAIEVANRLLESGVLDGIPNGVIFENIPYLSPTCCGCSGGGKHKAHGKGGPCKPASEAHSPNDTFFPQQWGLQRINAPNAWPLTKGDPNVVIAVLDQGVELAHPDLHLWPVSYSTITHTYNGGPVGNHGTACAGIISGRMDNSLGVAGLASDCRVMAIATNFADTEVAEGLYFAADNGARVVSMSFGAYPSWMIWNFAIIEAALQYCHDKNVVLVAASGNEDQAVSRFPGSDPRSICVGGSNRADVRKSVGDTSIENWWGACYGPSVDVVAPCLEIATTDRLGPLGYTATDYHLMFNGTSSATPLVAALAGLILSVDPALSNAEVREILSETTDKINAGSYVYLPTAGKPYGTWNNEVGYGRINAERAVLVACSHGSRCQECGGPCCVEIPEPEECCVSPCDPPWRPDEQCLVWYEEKFFRVPIATGDDNPPVLTHVEPMRLALRSYIEFRIVYEHKFCLLGKQHGPLLFTTTLLPGETIRLYHSDRYRRITSAEQRFSVQTTFLQFLSTVHQARVESSLDVLNDQLTKSSASSGSFFGGGLPGFGGGSESSSSSSVTSYSSVSAHAASEQFSQSVHQSSLLTHAERSVVVSTYEEKDVQDITARTLFNANECRAVTYFVRQVMELYAMSTRVFEISYRVVAPGVSPEWRSVDDLGWLPGTIQDQIKKTLKLLPHVGEVVTRPRPISLPTDGTVYDAELAHCCSCEPEREAAISIRLEKEKAEALKACLEAQRLELELQRRRLLLQKGELGPFEPMGAPEIVPSP